MGQGHTFRGKTRLLFQVLRPNLKKSLVLLIGMIIAFSEMITKCWLTNTLIQQSTSSCIESKENHNFRTKRNEVT